MKYIAEVRNSLMATYYKWNYWQVINYSIWPFNLKLVILSIA